jgi:hypothetical protein
MAYLTVNGWYTVDFKHSFQVLLGQVEKCLDLCNTCIRNHGVDWAEFGHGSLD